MGSARLAPVASEWMRESWLRLDPARACVCECVCGGRRATLGDWRVRETRVGVTQGQETCCLRVPVLVRMCSSQSVWTRLCCSPKLNRESPGSSQSKEWKVERAQEIFRERELGGEIRQ